MMVPNSSESRVRFTVKVASKSSLIVNSILFSLSLNLMRVL